MSMHSRFLRIAVLVIGASFASGVSAAPGNRSSALPEVIDLRAAIVYALENSFAIRQARERIQQQDGVILEVSALGIPNVGLGAAYQRNDTDISQSFPADDSAWQIQIQARQSLYSGGAVQGAAASARLVREAAVLELQAVISEVLLAVRTRFYDVLLARESIKVQEQSVALLEEQLQNARNRYEAGAASNFEVLRAEVALANAQPALIQARNTFRTSFDEVVQLMGGEAGSAPRTPQIVGDLTVEPVQYEVAEAVAAARASRPELARLSKLIEARAQGVEIARAGARPSVDLIGSYQWRKAGTSDRFSEARDGWLLGVQSQWSVFDGRATAGRVVQARSALAQIELARSEAELGIEIEVRRAVSLLQEAGELMEASRRVVEQATEALRLATVRQSAGTATQLDVLTSQVDLTQARNNQLRANYNYLVAVSRVRKATGQADPFNIGS
jgi:outer membrane protein TolC